MRLEHDPNADAAYVHVTDADVARTVRLDQDRAVDYDAEGAVAGYDFMNVSRGVRVDDLDRAQDIAALLNLAKIGTKSWSAPLSARVLRDRRAG